MDKKYLLSVIAIFKNEARYIREWIEYHRMVGVEHFYLYNNGSTDDYMEQLKGYIDKDIVTLVDMPGEKKQMVAYNEALKLAKEETIWAAVIDLDEFIVPTEHATIPEVMNSILERASKKFGRTDGFDMGMIGGIQLSWLYYGTSFHVNPPDGLVLENYLNRIRIEDDDNWCKNIYYVDHIDHIDNPHYTFQNGKVFVDEDGDYCLGIARAFSTKAKYMRVNHYTTKSFSEHLYKLTKRGFADGLVLPIDKINKLLDQGQKQFNEEFDPLTLRYVPALKSRLKNNLISNS